MMLLSTRSAASHASEGERCRLRAEVARLYRADEADTILSLVPLADSTPDIRAAIRHRAEALVAGLRQRAARGNGIDHFLQEYRLSTPEGIALLCLAEAFLRVPDSATAVELIKDKLSAGDWASHAGHSASRLVNLSTRALAMTRRFVQETEAPRGVVATLMNAGGEPMLRGAVAAAMRIMGGQFVMGRTIEEALRRARKEEPAFRHSFDMLGEGARTAADAERYLESYRHAIRHLGTACAPVDDLTVRPTISVKLSALHPRYEVAQSDRAIPELADRLISLCQEAMSVGIGLTVDAEEADRLELSLDIIERVVMAHGFAGWDGFGLAIQAYQKRARATVDWIDALARRSGARLMVRLVKGAYWDTEIKRAQERGLDGYPVFTRKAATDVSYLACARAMLSSSWLYPAFATHNALTAATLIEWAAARRDFEFQRLHGMGEGLYDALIARDGFACRVYAPVGVHHDLLAYLVRRLLENGANTSFVHQLADTDASVETLLADPVQAVRQARGRPHGRIPLPQALFGSERRNAAGVDLSDRRVATDIETRFATHPTAVPTAAPLIDGRDSRGVERAVHAPSDQQRIVGTVVDATASDVSRALQVADAFADDWARTSVGDRAAILERAADALESDRDAFLHLLVHEAGKTIPDAVAELREAVDFCRYYAVQARRDFAPIVLPGPTGEANVLALAGRGPFACISPWNFPLAIFLGQIAAALVAGNPVLAKPAPQTPLIAARAVRLLHRSGIPTAAIQLLPGGAEVGAALVSDNRIRGVAFTGSTGAARAIARGLAGQDGPIAPLIAETGGLNAMIVDSSALPEQVVGDILVSGFQSAGQRCSALRVLYLQDDSAERVLAMLRGAMDELVVGDPARLATDIGPVIDRAAQDRIQAHLAAGVGRRLHAVDLGAGCARGCFVAPALVELERASLLSQEVFGPVVHVVRWSAGHLDAVVAAINGSGYGLTLGVHSRIERTVASVRQKARVGNLYVNRSMIGAVVGVQPFGGEGLSGTGPKAGGPRYLARFATERTVSIDTTAAGGNASLMTMEEASVASDA